MLPWLSHPTCILLFVGFARSCYHISFSSHAALLPFPQNTRILTTPRPRRHAPLTSLPAAPPPPQERPVEAKKQPKADGGLADSVGVSLGPISLSFGDDMGRDAMSSSSSSSSGEASSSAPAKSIHSMTTEEWRAKYEKDGAVDLWVEEEFNAGASPSCFQCTSLCAATAAGYAITIMLSRRTAPWTCGWRRS